MKKTILILSTVLIACGKNTEWPERGKTEVLNKIKRGTVSIRCYKSSWMVEKALELRPEFKDSNNCRFDPDLVVWSNNDQVVNGTVRCTVGSYTGEYSIQAFYSGNSVFGSYSCNVAHFLTSETHPIGSVTDLISHPN